jgi:lipopolysaccharide export LptBFGC system permease protein LptF
MPRLPDRRQRALVRLLGLIVFAAILFFLFPITLALVEAAARSLRYLWWLVLLLALGIWLYWSASKKP